MARDVLGYPLSGERAARTLLVGAGLSALGLLFVPALVVAGYYGRVLASTAAGDEAAPGFADPAALLVHGVKTLVATVGYFLGMVVLLAVLGVAALVVGATPVGGGDALGLAALVVGGVAVLGVLWLPAWFFMPAVLAHLAHTGRVEAAFDLRTVVAIALDGRYLVRWAAGTGVFAVGWLVYTAIRLGTAGLLPGGGGASAWLGGHVVGAAANFYLEVVAFRLFGLGYAAAADARAAPADAGPEPEDAAAEWGRLRAGREGDDRIGEWGAESTWWRDERGKRRAGDARAREREYE